MGSSTGVIFRVTTWGESHGGGLGAIVEGCPPGIELDMDLIRRDLARRRPGQSKLTTQRKEPDEIQILSGVFEGVTLGTPISLMVFNKDANAKDYEPFKDVYRPSHADYTYDAKYGLRNWKGGGRSSARETVARVAAGAIARQVLAQFASVEIIAWVDRVGSIIANCEPSSVHYDDVESNLVRCPDSTKAAQMEALIKEVKSSGDTIGGIVRCVGRNVPAGWGAPVFDKLEADLAKGMLSLPAAKGFESGLGYGALDMRGSEHNDVFVGDGNKISTETNYSGGIQGGISNGMPIEISVAFKPVATVFKEQKTVNRDGENTTVKPRGRHDPCVLPRAVVMVEAQMALVLCDHMLRHRAQCGPT